MENIYIELMGNPETGSYGYLADMGKFPESLKDLNFLDMPPYEMKSNGIGMGWNGPYLLKGTSQESYLYDGWGSNYRYRYAYSDPASGTKGELVIISIGPDKREATSDDIEIRRKITTHQNIQVNVYVWQSGGWILAEDYKGMLLYSNSGEEASAEFSRARPVVRMVHRGKHAIYAVAAGKGYDLEGWKNFYVGQSTTSADVYLR